MYLVVKSWARLVAHLVVIVVVGVGGGFVVLIVIGVLHLVASVLRLLGRLGVVDDLATRAAAALDDVALVDGLEVAVVFIFVLCWNRGVLAFVGTMKLLGWPKAH